MIQFNFIHNLVYLKFIQYTSFSLTTFSLKTFLLVCCKFTLNLGDLEISASALQKNFFFLRSFYFCLLKFLMKKTSMVKSFLSTLAHLPRSFNRCLEQLFCRNLLALASEERNSTIDVISRVLKTLTAENCILHLSKF